MPKTTSALAAPLREQLDRLAAFEAAAGPVISLYLDLRPDQHGRDNYQTFLRKAFADRSRALKGEQRKSFDRDVQRITAYLEEHVQPSANGLAVFACAAHDDFFEAIQLQAPVEQHWLFVGPVPHLYPLARLNDQFPRYAALLLDTNTARLFVVGMGIAEQQRAVTNEKTKRTAVGGWSQARYQRHVENIHLHHIKEVAEVLERTVREEGIQQIVVAGDDVARPKLLEQLPPHVADKIVDVGQLDIRAAEHEVLASTLERMREKDAETDAEQVQKMLNAWNADGLAVAGTDDTLKALSLGQVEELLLTATPELLERASRKASGDVRPGPVDVDTSGGNAGADPAQHQLADELVARAQQTGARLRFIEDPALLEDVGGVGAMLRFKV